jgi:hypothetical protein
MRWGELSGYAASLLVFAAFYMRGMVALRLVAVASNVAFIIYAVFGGLLPVLVLHAALLPLNVMRLIQMRRFGVEIDELANLECPLRMLMPHMKRVEFPAAHTLFEANEAADELFYIVSGKVFLPQIDKEVGPGSFLGEFALFSESGRRMATAVARTDGAAMVLTKKAVFAALEDHSRLAIHLLRLITSRMLDTAARHSPNWPPDDCAKARGESRTAPVMAVPVQ